MTLSYMYWRIISSNCMLGEFIYVTVVEGNWLNYTKDMFLELIKSDAFHFCASVYSSLFSATSVGYFNHSKSMICKKKEEKINDVI